MPIVEVPNIFVTKTNHEYPPGNNIIFEEYFYNKFIFDIKNDKMKNLSTTTNFERFATKIGLDGRL
jgi:hypothetical protein